MKLTDLKKLISFGERLLRGELPAHERAALFSTVAGLRHARDEWEAGRKEIAVGIVHAELSDLEAFNEARKEARANDAFMNAEATERRAGAYCL